MPQRFVLSSLCMSLAAWFGAGQAWALGFARVQPTVTMGAPLDFVVGVRLDGGELLTRECVSAEVWIGDNPVPRSAVGATLETSGGSPAIRVRTLNRVDEPVVTVNITAGCEGRISRRFTIFADPPGLTAELPAVVSPEPVVSSQAPTLGAPAETAASRTRDVARPLPERPARTARQARPDRPAAARPVRKSVPGAAAVAQIKPDVAVEPPSDTAKAANPSQGGSAGGSGARLRLDAPSVTLVSDRAAVEAAERRSAELRAVRAAIDGVQAAASSASSRVATVEASVDELKKDARANRETMLRLQAALAESDERGRWTPWLIAAVLALLGVAGWLYARLRRAETAKQQAWWNSSHAVDLPAHADPATTSDKPSAQVTAAVPKTPTNPVAASTAASKPAEQPAFFEPPVPASQATQPMPAGLVVPDSPLRDVSIEELLDVEQQAEFFAVLGQDEAAIDLLMGHLRSTGGSSPLPYLKLLEIYHRRNDQASYDKMRRRFNDRFNATAPDWETGLQAGRNLEEYPGVIAQIQDVWPKPGDAMGELETLLFRTAGGDLFDLPAYRDILFLFTLVRDLQELAQSDQPRVDVLLPLGHAAADAGGAAGGSGFESMDLRIPGADPTAPSESPLAGVSSSFGRLDFEPRKAP